MLNPVDAIKKSTAADAIFKVIHDSITGGDLKPGDRLPAQDKLAVQFNVSRNTVREAIFKLTAIGLVEARQGVGTVVKAGDPTRYVSSLTDHLRLDDITARQFLETRVLIETAAVGLAVRRRGEDQLASLTDLVQRQKEAFDQGRLDDFNRLDARFHLELVRASGNRVLGKVLQAAWDMLVQLISQVAEEPLAVDRAINFHIALLKALEYQDAAAARSVLRDHLKDVGRSMERRMDRDFDLDVLFSAIG